MALAGAVVSLCIFIAIYAVFAMGLNLKFGYAGLLDIGHVAFYLIGAYVAALLVAPPAETQQFSTYVLGLSLPWLPATLVAVVAAAVFGMLVALPAIRLREDYLAITLLGVSVIAQRVIQVEGWLASGPGTLSGYDLLLQPYFPLPSDATAQLGPVALPAGALTLGGVVAVVWAVTTALLVGRLGEADTIRDRLVHGYFLVTTLGVGYLAALRANPASRIAPAVLAGVVAGVAATAMSLAGLGALAVLLFFGFASLFLWGIAVVVVRSYYAELSRREWLVAAGLAVAFVIAFVPLVVLGGSGTSNLLSRIGLLVTTALLVAYVYGIYRLSMDPETLGIEVEFVRIVGVAAVVLFALRYFLLSLINPFRIGGVLSAFANLIQNTLWLVTFQTLGSPMLGYNRFMLLLSVAVAAGVYLGLELTVGSPFGRVLRAIREDEDVATALGKNTFAYKVQAMMLGSAIAGLAGVLWAIFAQGLIHTMFAPRVTFFAFLMVIIGGTANNRGVILGSAIYWLFQQATADIAGFFPPAARSSVQALRLVFIGALLILILYYRPEGIWGEERLVSDGGES